MQDVYGIPLADMRDYLSKSLASLNKNKLVGLLAEIAFRKYLSSLGWENRVTPGGWIARPRRSEKNPAGELVLIPILKHTGETDEAAARRSAPFLLPALQLHMAGVKAIACFASSPSHVPGDFPKLTWTCQEIRGTAGGAIQGKSTSFPQGLTGLSARVRRHAFLKYKTDTKDIPDVEIAGEFSKEACRVTFQEAWQVELTDFDGILFGKQKTYPIEIKEKSVGSDKATGDYFGLDLGPFVKLAFFNVRDTHLEGIFIVHEVGDGPDRPHRAWWMAKFGDLARHASWQPRGGGRNMLGGSSSTVMVPKWAFRPVNRETLDEL